jgi:hypothetical protein
MEFVIAFKVPQSMADCLPGSKMPQIPHMDFYTATAVRTGTIAVKPS